MEKAVCVKQMVGGGEPLPMEEVSTPGKASIEEVSTFLNVPPERTLKAVFYVVDDEFVFVVIRGDMEVNEVKLQRVLEPKICAWLPIVK